MDWKWIGDELALDWHQIGKGSAQLADIGLATDWQWIGTGLTMDWQWIGTDWHWIGNRRAVGLSPDWHRIGVCIAQD